MASSILIPALALFASLAAAEDARIRSEDSIPDWVSDVALGMTLSTVGGEDYAYQYFVVPLTTAAEDDQTESPSTVTLEGNMVHIDAENFDEDRDDAPQEVAYLSCDDPSDDSDPTPDEMVNKVMGTGPIAIVLYSLAGNGCALEGTDLIFDSIFTMIDSGDAQQALVFLNGTAEDDDVHVAISGNVTEVPNDESAASRGTTSAVAMSVLYSITGLVTLLFLVIIGTGTIRAHRYPERYGLRSANGSRPAQSRAKGIARAVLDTLPIVKFGGSSSAKPDPDLETQTDAGSRRSSRTGGVRPQARDAPVTTDADTTPPVVTSPAAIPLASLAKAENKDGGKLSPSAVVTQVSENDEDNLGCTICTEDFSVGEDVRVLPCSHKFHPACVDPWLTNVSGTCPLCRLDLRPPNERDGESSDDDASMPPPLELEGAQDDAHSTTQRRRMSRFLDLARLRHASPEERIQALRQYRRSEAQTQEPTSTQENGDRGRRAKLAGKLRDKFRIRTRTESPGE